ncbi:hypothetical protein PP935_gp216 [Rhizobium phage RHph_N34]|uniref:Uncharacterized protein n=1 Tax=Rhizobium phage RHph_N34 TaxID=2509586 RepID=A0A7S5RA95_9CAUD|nr:hypothetical protein PP935_gp216 [Rhizobium phage RHph_N34]QIG73991.1 hypothetical protein EVC06_216 [Rhizobium phage RHph_N34]
MIKETLDDLIQSIRSKAIEESFDECIETIEHCFGKERSEWIVNHLRTRKEFLTRTRSKSSVSSR